MANDAGVCLIGLQKKSWIDGTHIAEATKLRSTLDVHLDKTDASHDTSSLWNSDHDVRELILVRENDILRVIAPHNKDNVLNGYYRYTGTMSPVKGPNVHEWGRGEL